MNQASEFEKLWTTELPKLKANGWHIAGNGNIRDRDGRCPVCAIAHALKPELNFHQEAFQALGRLDPERYPDWFANWLCESWYWLAEFISASDWNYRNATRTRILGLLELEEKKDE